MHNVIQNYAYLNAIKQKIKPSICPVTKQQIEDDERYHQCKHCSTVISCEGLESFLYGAKKTECPSCKREFGEYPKFFINT